MRRATLGTRPAPMRETSYYANDPRIAEPAFGPVRDDASASARWSRVWKRRCRCSRGCSWFPVVALVSARARTSRGDQLRLRRWRPDVSASWQVLRRLPLFVRASSVRRVDADLDFVSRSTLPSPVVPVLPVESGYQRFRSGMRCSAVEPAGSRWGCRAAPSGVDASGQPCRGAASDFPRSWENTVGFGLVPVEGLRADVDLVHRRGDGPWQAIETNRLWNDGRHRSMQRLPQRPAPRRSPMSRPRLQRSAATDHCTPRSPPRRGPVAVTSGPRPQPQQRARPEPSPGFPHGSDVVVRRSRAVTSSTARRRSTCAATFSVGALYSLRPGRARTAAGFRNDATSNWDGYRFTLPGGRRRRFRARCAGPGVNPDLAWGAG